MFAPGRAVRPLALMALAAAVVALGGCSSQQDAPVSAPSAGGAADFTIPDSGCGSFDAPLPADSAGVIGELSAAQQESLAGYTNYEGSTLEIVESAWADWKPEDSDGFTVGISWGQLVSPFQTTAVDGLQEVLNASDLVDDVIVTSTSSNFDIPQQIQQYQSLVQQGADLIILQAVAGAAFVEPVEAAAAAGVPTVTLVGPVPSASAVNVDGNNYLASAVMASFLVQQLDGQGDVLMVHALESTALDAQADAAWASVLENCPDITVAGEIYGHFSDADAKSETLKFLATHPGQIDGVLEASAMSVGVMQAFLESGRPMPVVPDSGGAKGAFGYWQENEATFPSISTTMPAVPAYSATAEVALRMLSGQGVQTNAIVDSQPIITVDDLAEWAEPDWTLDTPGIVVGTRGSMFLPDFLDAFFASPAAVD